NGSTTASFASVNILKRTCDIDDAHSEDAHIAKVRQHLAEASMDQDEGTPYLLHVLGATNGVEPLGPLPPEILRARTLDTLRGVLLQGSRHRASIIAVEDLHWIDPTSEQLLSSLVENLAAARVLLVVTYRSGYRPSWTDRSYTTEISLQALSPEESLAVIRSTIGEQQLPDALADAIVERGEGNPFFLEELTRATEAGFGAGKEA